MGRLGRLLWAFPEIVGFELKWNPIFQRTDLSSGPFVKEHNIVYGPVFVIRTIPSRYPIHVVSCTAKEKLEENRVCL